MEKVNDERDILKQYLQKVFRIDYSIKENDIVKSLGTKISLISNECSLPLDIRSLFIPPIIQMLFHKLYGIFKTLNIYQFRHSC